MRFAILIVIVALLAVPAHAQQPVAEARLKALAPYETMRARFPGLTREQYEAAVRQVAQSPALPAAPAPTSEPKQPVYLGQLSSNAYAPNSTANPYGTHGSPYAPTSINNPYGKYGSPYSSTSATNPYATSTPKIFAKDGQYLGKLSANPYDPESVSNPFGKYGSPYSSTSINNPYSKYGSQYSPLSPTNPYSTQGPVILHKP
jgi:hypothetical protein